MTQEIGFSEKDTEALQLFFQEEIKKRDAREIIKTYERLLKDVTNSKLRKYLIEYVAKNKNLKQ